MKKVVVIGAGQMGSGVAQVAAQYGFSAVVVDISEAALAQSRNVVTNSLTRLKAKGVLSETDEGATLERMRWSRELKDVSNAELVIEAIPENEALKKAILRDVDAIVHADAVIASNTSAISITRLASVLKRPEQFIGMHFMNPVPIMKLVEVIRGLGTSDETYARTKAMAEKMGKVITTSRDFPGFIANRILMPMINEAFYALMEGIATAEDIDMTMKLGTNQPMGPLTLADFIGLDTCLAIMQVLHEEMGDSKYRPCPLLRQYVDAGFLGKKKGRGVFTYGI